MSMCFQDFRKVIQNSSPTSFSSLCESTLKSSQFLIALANIIVARAGISLHRYIPSLLLAPSQVQSRSRVLCFQMTEYRIYVLCAWLYTLIYIIPSIMYVCFTLPFPIRRMIWLRIHCCMMVLCPFVLYQVHTKKVLVTIDTIAHILCIGLCWYWRVR